MDSQKQTIYRHRKSGKAYAEYSAPGLCESGRHAGKTFVDVRAMKDGTAFGPVRTMELKNLEVMP